jgi:hypothetical protein
VVAFLSPLRGWFIFHQTTHGLRPFDRLRASWWAAFCRGFAAFLLARVTKMKFAKVVFWIAAGWGVLVLTPLYFMFDLIGRNDPPVITHPGFYYGFVGAGLAWQFGFAVIARDPVRFRLMMVPAVLEKFSYGAALIVLFLQGRLHSSDLVFPVVDLFLGVLFVIAFLRTG